MRILKFRAWDNLNIRWLMGYELPNLGGFSLTGESILFGEWANCFDEFIFEKNGKSSIDLVIEQYIGRQDKNHVDIYEGDLVKCVHVQGLSFEKTYVDTGVVEFGDQGMFSLKCVKRGCENAKDPKKKYFHISFKPDREFTVIGNIHQNQKFSKESEVR